MYGPLKPENWFNKNGEQVLFEFESKTSAASFDWSPEKKQIENISMIRPLIDSMTFEKQMVSLGMINTLRDRLYSMFISQDYEIVVLRDATPSLKPNTEMLMIVRRDSKMWANLPPLPKKFNKKKR